MIRLNKIFGRKSTQEHDPMAGSATLTPPQDDADWDEGLADAYLLAQERAMTDAPVARPMADPPPVISIPPMEPPVAQAPDATETLDRMAMARQQLAAAQGQASLSPAMQLDLSEPTGAVAGRRVGRVKTRLLGFDHAPGLTQDPIEAARAAAPATVQNSCPVGWIVVIGGPGRGAHFALFNGVSQIGRGEDQAVKLDFGDGSISRTNHAAIAYDDETNGFFLGHGGKTNIVRLNDRPVISTETLTSQDMIRIGETTLLFVALCNDRFHWAKNRTGPDDYG